MATLTKKRLKFCEYYATPDSETAGNGTQSARKAGFAARYAKIEGSRLLTLPEIQSAIAEIEKRYADRFDWTKREWLNRGIAAYDELPSSSANKVRFWELIGKCRGYLTDEARTINNTLILTSSDLENIRKSIKDRLNSNEESYNTESKVVESAIEVMQTVDTK